MPFTLHNWPEQILEAKDREMRVDEALAATGYWIPPIVILVLLVAGLIAAMASQERLSRRRFERRYRSNRLPADAMFRERVVRAHNALRSEEHTSELQSLAYLVCRLLLEKK